MNTKNQINIFIVEDNKVFTLALKADIETSFANKLIKIHLFERGESCMKKFKEVKPQVVILDYHLNGKYPNAADGIQILDWIKKENPSTSVIMLTCDDNIEIASTSFKHGASDYVVKTETQFRKVNYSLLNLFKMVEANNEMRKYRHAIVLFVGLIALLIIGVIAIQIFDPSLIER